MKIPVGDSKKQNVGTQFDRFVETARKLGCDEDKERFEKSLGKIAGYKPLKKKIRPIVKKPMSKRKVP